MTNYRWDCPGHGYLSNEMPCPQCEIDNPSPELKIIKFSPAVSLVTLTKEEAGELIKYIYDQGYISHEFHPGVYDICKKLEKFIEGK